MRVAIFLFITIFLLIPSSRQSPTTCSPSYFYSNTYNDCRPCSSNCSRCTNLTVCEQCYNGYYLNEQAQCRRCYVSNCFLCINNTCSICQDGYRYVKQTCVQNSLNIYLSYLVGGVLLSGIIFVICCCYVVRKCREQQRFRIIENRVSESHAQSQVEIKFDETWIESNEMQSKREQICSFCLQASVNLQLSCSHLYHMDCISRWLIRHPQCPICKRVVSGECKLYCSICLKCDIKFDSSLITTNVLLNKRACQKCRSQNQAK